MSKRPRDEDADGENEALEARLGSLTAEVRETAKQIVAAKEAGRDTDELRGTALRLRQELAACMARCSATPGTTAAPSAAPATATSNGDAQPAVDGPSQAAAAQQDAERKKSLIQLKVHHVPTWASPRFSAWLKRNRIEFELVEKEASATSATIFLATEEHREKAARVLNTLCINGALLACSGGDTVAPPKVLMVDAVAGSSARFTTSTTRFEPPKRAKLEKNKFTNKRAQGLPDIRDVVADLWRQPYSQQVGVKYTTVLKAMDAITWGVALSLGPHPQPAWLTAAGALVPGNAPCCAMTGLLRSPQTDEYRNKAEFSIGYDEQRRPTVGFFYGLFKDGFMEVGEPTAVPHISATSKGWAALMTRFLRSEHPQLPAWDKKLANDRGFWRLVVVREGREATYMPRPGESAPWDREAAKQVAFDSLDVAPYQVDLERSEQGQPGPEWRPSDAAVVAQLDTPPSPAPVPDACMVLVEVNDKHKCPPGAVEAELKRWAAFVRVEKPPELPLTSLLVRYNSGCSNAAPDGAPVMACPGWEGEEVGLRETLLNLRFHISPGGFFQNNTPATALLYKVVADWAAPTADTLLFDICCGAGTIGLTLARSVKKVVGVDSVAASVTAARKAAADNGIGNCEFHCGRAETMMQSLLAECGREAYDSVVAVVDPPRSGLHKSVLYALLGCGALTRIVYVSCNPETLAANAQELCLPPQGVKRRHYARAHEQGRENAEAPRYYKPFAPVRCKAVDLFPHTSHVECVLLLERE